MDNTVKYSIYQNPNDNYIYAKIANFDWGQCHPTGLCDFPPTRLKLATENMGMEIMLNASKCRKFLDSNTDLALGEDNEVKSVLDEKVPNKSKQETYDHENSCVCISMCLLVYSVDKESSDNMIELYIKDPDKLEWLDLFN